MKAAFVGGVEVADLGERRPVEDSASEPEAEETVEGWDAAEDAEHRLGDKIGLAANVYALLMRSPSASTAAMPASE